MQLPSGAGVWPAFWLAGVNGISKTRTTNSAEIDILEAYGVDMPSPHNPCLTTPIGGCAPARPALDVSTLFLLFHAIKLRSVLSAY